MTEKICEASLWDYLKIADKPIVLYGMGNGADMIIDVLHCLGLDFADVFASDSFVRGHYFHGRKVLKLSEVKEKHDDFIILLTFAIHDRATLDYIKDLSQSYELYSPTVPVAGKGLFTYNYIKEHEEEFDEAYNLLYDERSKEDFLSILNFKISGKVKYLFECEYEKSRLYDEILPLGDNETIVDLGAYDGDTIREFTAVTKGKYKKIIAFEPDEKNFKKLSKKTEGMENIHRYNLGAWDKRETLLFAKKAGRNSHRDNEGVPVNFDSVDNLINEEVTFIKMDIEGAELKALEGARNTIKKYSPKLYVCAYHRNEDMFTLPSMIKLLNPEYKIYFRHHPYIPAWESNFYATI